VRPTGADDASVRAGAEIAVDLVEDRENERGPSWRDRCNPTQSVTVRFARLQVLPGGRARRGRLVAVTGGKGGIGKSTLALNLALTLAGNGARTAMVDTDLGAAGLSVLLGATTERGLRAALDGVSLDELLIPTHGAWLLPGTLGGELRGLGDTGLRRVLGLVKTLTERFDTVVLDVAAGVGEHQAALAAMADDVLVVVTPDPPSLAAAYACLERLASRGVRRAYVLPNQATPSQAVEVGNRLVSLAQRLLDLEVTVLPSVPTDASVHDSMLAALPLVVRRPDSAASRGLARICDVLDPTPAAPSATGALQ
jgi:flagellar biosynthesis protein FlhG